MSRQCRTPRTSTQRGSSLIEVLVVMVIFSIGILGVAALQIVGLTSNSTAMHRSQATILAYGIIDSMRSNPAGAKAGSYALAAGATAPTGTTTAAQDLNKWLAEVAARLPSGTATITNAAFATTGEVTVTVTWDERRSKQTATASLTSFTIRSRL